MRRTMRSQTPEPPQDDVLAAIRVERDAVAAGDIERYLAVLTGDAIFMPPNSPSKTRAELHDWLRGFLEGFRVEWLRFASTETQVEGDMAFHSYTYTWRVSPRAGGEPTISSGKGVHLLRRQPGGLWKIAREMWNGSPAGPP